MVETPKFIESEFFVSDFGNWHLKEGAPEDIKEEFEAFMSLYNENSSVGIDI